MPKLLLGRARAKTQQPAKQTRITTFMKENSPPKTRITQYFRATKVAAEDSESAPLDSELEDRVERSFQNTSFAQEDSALYIKSLAEKSSNTRRTVLMRINGRRQAISNKFVYCFECTGKNFRCLPA